MTKSGHLFPESRPIESLLSKIARCYRMGATLENAATLADLQNLASCWKKTWKRGHNFSHQPWWHASSDLPCRTAMLHCLRQQSQPFGRSTRCPSGPHQRNAPPTLQPLPSVTSLHRITSLRHKSLSWSAATHRRAAPLCHRHGSRLLLLRPSLLPVAVTRHWCPLLMSIAVVRRWSQLLLPPSR